MKALRPMIKFDLLILCILLAFVSHADANQSPSYKCPTKIAYANSTGPMVRDAITILKNIYRDLGCDTNFVPLPGRRAIRDFNNGLVSGEIFRAEIVEKLYTRNFIRSSIPIFTFNSSIWRHPKKETRNQKPIGFHIGIIWQETYMKDRSGRQFHTSDQIFSAYNKGQLGGFIASNYSVLNKLRNKDLAAPPYLEEQVFSAPMRHYLHQEFSEFMLAFNQYIKVHSPFRKLDQITP